VGEGAVACAGGGGGCFLSAANEADTAANASAINKRQWEITREYDMSLL
jgi:hypothetical protein